MDRVEVRVQPSYVIVTRERFEDEIDLANAVRRMFGMDGLPDTWEELVKTARDEQA